MNTLIKNAFIVNEGRIRRGSLLIDGGHIASEVEPCPGSVTETIDATGCYVLPGIIDEHVHFREPGMTRKADMESESRAAAFGGVTSFMDMPNTVPPATTVEALDRKFDIARAKSHVNYSFFFGATNGNAALLSGIDRHRVPGIKLFMGSSTGGMLVDSKASIEEIFRQATLPIVAHCEDNAIINANVAEAQRRWGGDPSVEHHTWIRSAEACLASTELAVRTAGKYGARLHVAHVSTGRELDLFGNDPRITAEATVAHLLFCDRDYARLGSLIKCNPSVKTDADRNALRRALTDGRIVTVATDHAPHTLEEKEGGCLRAASGMPMVQFSLVAMLGLVDEGILTIERLVQLMCHNPARLFGIDRRGFIRKGYWADIVIVRRNAPWTLAADMIQSKCKWSPLTGTAFNWRVEHTFCNGVHIYDRGTFRPDSRGMELRFRADS